MEKIYLNVVKAKYHKSTVNTLNGILKAFSLRPGKIQGWLHCLLLFTILLKIFATKIRKEEKFKNFEFGKNKSNHH